MPVPIQYVGGQVGQFAGTTTTQTITFSLSNGLAATPAANDLVIVAYAVGSTADRTLDIETTGAVDYTVIGSELYANGTFDTNLRVAYRFMPSTPETDFRFAGGTGNNADAGAYTVHVFRGVYSTVHNTTAQTNSGTGTRLANPPAITPVSLGAWIYVAGAGAMGTGGTYTAAYLTDLRVTTQVDTNDVNIASGYVVWDGAGQYDPAAFGGGGTDNAADSWAAVTAALQPDIGVPQVALARGGSGFPRV